MELVYDKTCLVVWPEWGSSGIWHPQTRGQSGAVSKVSHEDLGLPKSLALLFDKWIDWFNDAAPGDGRAKTFDWVAFDLQGLALAHALAEFVGDKFSVDYHGNTGVIVVSN